MSFSCRFKVAIRTKYCTLHWSNIFFQNSGKQDISQTQTKGSIVTLPPPPPGSF